MSEKLHTYKLANGSHPIRNDDGRLVALVSASAYEQRAQEEATELVHRWNNYAAMLEALRDALSWLESSRDCEADLSGIRAALAQARGEGGAK